MSPISDFRPSEVRGSLFGRWQFSGKARRRKRSARPEVSQLEGRTLMSGMAAHKLTHASAVAAHVRTAQSRSDALASAKTAAALPSIPLIDRLGWYDTGDSGKQQSSFAHFVQLDPDHLSDLETKLQSSDVEVYVLVHGLALGYQDWVNRYANGAQLPSGQKLKANHTILDWWQTIPENYAKGASSDAYKNVVKYGRTGVRYDTTEPVSPWLLEGHTSTGSTPIRESDNGLAWDLTHFGNQKKNAPVDPNVVVLAYSWLDDAATSGARDSLGVPTFGALAQAATELNGQRLAAVLEQLMGPDANGPGTMFKGKLQLIGHSFGSKVATVAADALTTSNDAIHVNQLTLLDSPESGNSTAGFGLASYGDTNDNWYFLPDLKISDTPSADQTFVDNYWSALGEPINAVTYQNATLKNIVDVKLQPLQYESQIDPWRHTYAAEWYAGSSERTSLTNGQKVGRQWSPLLTDRGAPASQSFIQNWLNKKLKPVQEQQFDLAGTKNDPINPIISSLTLTPVPSGPTVTSVTLKGPQSLQYTFDPADTKYGIRGLLFQYRFTNFVPKDELDITLQANDGDPARIAFRMQPLLIQPDQPPVGKESSQPVAQNATISMGAYLTYKYTLTFTLKTQSNDSSVTVSSLNQYGY